MNYTKMTEFFKILGLNAELETIVHAYNLDLEFDEVASFTFARNGEAIHVVMIDADVVDHLLEGDEKVTSTIEMVRERFIQAFAQISALAAGSGWAAKDIAAVIAGEDMPIVDQAADDFGPSVHVLAGKTGDFGVYDITSGDSGAGPLSSATKVYEPVTSTSPGSRYYVMAAAPELRLAMRWRKGKLSIRVEGSALASEEFRTYLSKVGFTTVNSNYASFHIDIGGTLLLARKTCGSILSSVWPRWHTPLPDIGVIFNKGK